MRKALLTTLLLAALAPASASASATAPGPIVYGYADQGGQVQTEVTPPTPRATPDVRPEVLGQTAEGRPGEPLPGTENPQPAEPASGSGASARSDSPRPTTSTSTSTLPFTGQDIGVLALVGLVLLCLGMTLRGVSRPRGQDSGLPPGLGALDPARRR